MRLPYISHFAASKSTFSYEFSHEPTSKSTFRARLPSIFITCHKMQRLPRDLHLVTTSRSADNAIREKHATRHVQSIAPATQNDIGGVESAVPATNNMKNATHLLKATQKYCACYTERLLTRHGWNVLECHKVPRLPREMKLCDAGKLQNGPLLQNFP